MKCLQISLTPGFLEESWFHIPVSLFNLLQYIALVEVYEDSDISLKMMGVFQESFQMTRNILL